MKRLKKISGAIIALMIIIFCMANSVFAEEIDYLMEALSDEAIEFSDEYQEWLQLSDEEKLKGVQPVTFVIPKTKAENTNPINIVDTLAATYETKFDLRDIIKNNVSIKNQKQ